MDHFKANIKQSGQQGSIAMEYLMVTLFSLVVGVALLGVSSKIIKQKLESLGENSDITIEDFNLGPFLEIE